MLLEDYKKRIEAISRKSLYYEFDGVSRAFEQMSLEQFKELIDRFKVKEKDMLDLIENHSPRFYCEYKLLSTIDEELTRKMTLQEYRQTAIKWAQQTDLPRAVDILRDLKENFLASYKEDLLSPPALAYGLEIGFL
jgi:hypothetical protein